LLCSGFFDLRSSFWHLLGQRLWALVEHQRLRATLAAGGALLLVSVYEVDREGCAREILSRFCALEINVQDFA
jgi:hypothetical protein